MLEWANLDLGELTLMRHDIEVLTRMADFEERDVEPTEGSIDNEVAEALNTPKSLSAIYAEYKREIDRVKENKLKDELRESQAAAAGNPPTEAKVGDKAKGRRKISAEEHAATAAA